jgi:signal transduction histidine kinase
VHRGFNDQLSKWTARLPFSSLRARLLLLLFLALLPAYGFILYSVFEARQQAAEHARENALWLTRLMASEQKSLIEVIRQQLQSLAQLSIVHRPEQAALCSRTFASLRAQNSFYANLGVINADGTLRCSALPFAGRVNLSDRDFFRETLRTRAFAVGGYQIDRVTGKGSANLAYPVLDAASSPQAAVFIALDLGALADRLIETTSLPEGSTLTILDNHGTILARQPDPEQWVGQSLPDAPLIQTIRSNGEEGSAEETGIDGVERLYVFKLFYSTAAKQIYISAGIPTAAVFADAQRLLARALLLMALVTAAAAAVIWVGSNDLLLRPAATLMRATRRLGQGDLSARTDLPHTSDEFGQIAHSFDGMASALQARESEAARAEEEIHRLNADLERKVTERTAELAAANQELEAFSYSVSHDLRAPLRAIDGFSQAVIEDYADKLGDQGRDYLNRVRAATQHMGHLIDDLIKLARVARAEMKRETVDLSALAGSVLVDLQTSEPTRKVDSHIEPGLVAAGDARLLRVALDNLLGNAWKFTGKKARARIEFGVLQQASPGMDEVDRLGNKLPKTGEQVFFVRDNGVGFDMTYAGKLFSAFQRLHNVSEFPGTGIGLATVRRIVHRHGGRVWAEGVAGKGATFYFSL